MLNRQSLPTVREAAICCAALLLWLGITAAFIGFRPEHVVMALLVAALFFLNRSTRRLVVALLPFVVFGISYDWMNLLPNYKVNPVDVAGLYSAEKGLFGITGADGMLLTPNEYFALHTNPVADFLAGCFYLCWVPVPIIFGLWLYFTGKRTAYLHFALVFLLVNLIGFTCYYLHPAAPPWYVAMHGMTAVEGTPGEVAGLGAFDRMTGLDIFNALYARNSNVFAALPSLHSAYMPVALIYAIRSRSSKALIAVLAVITVGIWATAVYTSHHYLIDVIGGVACTAVGYLLFEHVLMRIPAFARFIGRYARYISLSRA